MKIFKAVEVVNYPFPHTLKSMTRSNGVQFGGVIYELGHVTLPHPNHGPFMAFDSLEAAIECARHWKWDCEIYEGQAILDPVQHDKIARSAYSGLFWNDRETWLGLSYTELMDPPRGTVFCKAVMLEKPVAKILQGKVYEYIYKVVREENGLLKSAIRHDPQDGVEYDLEYSTRFFTRPEAGLLLAFNNREAAEHFLRVENAVSGNKQLYGAWGKVEKRDIRRVSWLVDNYSAWWSSNHTYGMPVDKCIGCSSIMLIGRLDERTD